MNDEKACVICKRIFIGKNKRQKCCSKECSLVYVKNMKTVYMRIYGQKNRERIEIYQKKYNRENKEKISENKKRYYCNNIERIKKSREKYNIENVEILREKSKKRYNSPRGQECHKIYVEKNRQKINEYQRNRRKNNIKARIHHCFSSMMGYHIKDKNNQHSFDLLGYSCEDLIKHLESKFKPGMSWKNYGKSGWEIDHIIPVSKFNISSLESPDFKRAWALNNLQPLWRVENQSKSNRLDQPFQPFLDLRYVDV